MVKEKEKQQPDYLTLAAKPETKEIFLQEKNKYIVNKKLARLSDDEFLAIVLEFFKKSFK